MPSMKASGPLSLTGFGRSKLPKDAFNLRLTLKVIDAKETEEGYGGLSPDAASCWAGPVEGGGQPRAAAGAAAGVADLQEPLQLQLAGGSDCVASVKVDADVPPGSLALTRLQQFNLRIASGHTYDFSLFPGPPEGEPFLLTDLDAEVRLMGQSRTANVTTTTTATAVGAAAQATAGDGGNSGDATAEATAGMEEGEEEEEEEGGSSKGNVEDVDMDDADGGGAPSGSEGVGYGSNGVGGGAAAGAEAGAAPEVVVDASRVAQLLSRAWFQRVVSVNEVAAIDYGGGVQLLVRITATNTLDAEAREQALAYHCYRGMVTPDTQIYLQTASDHHQQHQQQGSVAGAASAVTGSGGGGSGGGGGGGGGEDLASRLHSVLGIGGSGGGAASAATASASAAGRPALVLANARQRPSGGEGDVILVTTQDGEVFPVKRPLLRPAIALTRAVRGTAGKGNDTRPSTGNSGAGGGDGDGDSGGGGGGSSTPPEVKVDVDTLTFDRVLIFLEAEAEGRPPPSFGVHLLGGLLQAAQVLGLRALQTYCSGRLGALEARVRLWRYEEVVKANKGGQMLLILDGMVLDVTRWLPEHPGGSTIIPAQALNLDCSRFFEVYHVSRESFLYLKEFYVGEVAAQDLGFVPCPPDPPSRDFVEQLRRYTSGFRARDELEPGAGAGDGVKAFKSF